MIGLNPTVFHGVRNEAVLLFIESDAGRAGPHVLHHHMSAPQASPQARRHRDALHQHDHRYVPPPRLKLGDTGTLYINMTTGMYPPASS